MPPIPSRFVLLEKNDKVTFLLAPNTVSLSKYINLKAIVTGEYEISKSILKITKPEDIEIIE